MGDGCPAPVPATNHLTPGPPGDNFMALADRIASGLASGWKVTDAATLTENTTLEADVVVIGTGAGGGTTAEILAGAGLSVIMVEEGRLHYQKDFNMDEL